MTELGRHSWRIFFQPLDSSQAVFNLGYHAGQDMGRILDWPISFYREMVEKLRHQWEFEEKERNKAK